MRVTLFVVIWSLFGMVLWLILWPRGREVLMDDKGVLFVAIIFFLSALALGWLLLNVTVAR